MREPSPRHASASRKSSVTNWDRRPTVGERLSGTAARKAGPCQPGPRPRQGAPQGEPCHARRSPNRPPAFSAPSRTPRWTPPAASACGSRSSPFWPRSALTTLGTVSKFREQYAGVSKQEADTQEAGVRVQGSRGERGRGGNRRLRFAPLRRWRRLRFARLRLGANTGTD